MATFDKRGRYWRAQVRRRGFPPQARTFDSKVEAEVWAREVETQMDKGQWLDLREASLTTLAHALKRYGKEVTPHKAESGQRNELLRINAIAARSIGHYYLTNLRGADLARYRDERLTPA